jgi:hypothetical protein
MRVSKFPMHQAAKPPVRAVSYVVIAQKSSNTSKAVLEQVREIAEDLSELDH